MTNTVQYDSVLADTYDAAKAEHPLNHVIYETWLGELGDIAEKRVLELACGTGHGSRLLAKHGASVLGVDISREMISRALEEELRNPMDISYLVSDVNDLNLSERFDIVAPSFLYHYASTREELSRLFELTAKHLVPGGRLVALNATPDGIVPKMKNCGHRTEWESDNAQGEGARIRLYLMDEEGQDLCSFTYYNWNQKTYEDALRAQGFIDIRWVIHDVPTRLRAIYENWHDLLEHNASLVLSARKKS
jgi:SAM-dependent methyltransferase